MAAACRPDAPRNLPRRLKIPRPYTIILVKTHDLGIERPWPNENIISSFVLLDANSGYISRGAMAEHANRGNIVTTRNNGNDMPRASAVATNSRLTSTLLSGLKRVLCYAPILFDT